MFLSLIIPTHHRAFQVEKLLKSVSLQDFPQEELELLLISNFEDKALRARLPDWEQTFLNFKYKEVGLKSVNKARNMGIRFARGDILYFLDDDCFLPHKKHLKNILQAHKKRPESAGIGGPYKTKRDLGGLEKFYHESSELWLNSASQKGSSFQLLGGNASYKKFVFEMGYYFDPSIVFGGSEESFNSSIKEYGLIIDKNLWVYHHPQLKGFAFIKKSFQQGVGASKNQSKNLEEKEESFDSKWAFSHGEKRSAYSFLYQFFFKIGYFWEASSSKKEGLILKSLRFLFFILKSRWYFLKNFFAGWFYGKVVARVLGKLWQALGLLWYGLGLLWYGLGWFYGKALLFLFHRSPPMKIYYFSQYQYQTRVKPFLMKKRLEKNNKPSS